jgi:drug/metabolite transporter (DMT)-like permease
LSSPLSHLSGPRSPKAVVLTALAAVQVMFATNYVATKVVLEEIPPLPWAAMRTSGAALLLLALVRLRREKLPLDPPTVARFAGLALLGIVVNQLCFTLGLARTTPIHSALINSSIPVLTLLIAVLLGREVLTTPHVGGFLLALTGVLVLLRVWNFEPGSLLVSGDLITLVNSLSFSAFLVVSKPHLQRTPTLPATCLLFVLGAIPMVGLALPQLVRLDFSAVSARTWILGAYIIIVPTVVTYFLNYWALRRAESSLVALFVYLQPLLAGVFSMMFLGEHITFRLVGSFILVAGGIALVAWSPRGRRVDPPGELRENDSR